MEDEPGDDTENEPEDASSSSMGQEELQRYKSRLHGVQKNESNEFHFGDDYDQREEHQWTIEQWNELFTELFRKNTSVESITAGIHVCPVEALSTFVSYLRTGNNIKRLTIQYITNYNQHPA
jgi:hypothetical protein